MIHVISLGAGVQSTTLALMAAAGEITPMPDCAIFADTGWEPKSVYAHLERLIPALPFPVHVVSAGDLRANTLKGVNQGGRFSAIPWFMISPRGKHGLGRRQCTYDYKITPIRQKLVDLTGGRRKGSVELWIGISLDEAMRRRDSNVQYINHRWPLLEKRIARRHCVEWLEARSWNAPKSACGGCPFHSDAMWRDQRDNDPEEWQRSLETDRAIRRQPGFRGEQYMHAKRIPLDEVDLSTAEDWGQIDLFNNECEGMCGV